jgi:pilus assembly protein CpaB
MRGRVLMLLVVAMAVAGGTLYFTRQWLQAERDSMTAEVIQEVPEQLFTYVLVASQGLDAGNFVKPEDLRWQAWPDDTMAEEYVIQGMAQMEDYVGAVVRSHIAPGEPITVGRVVRPGERGFLAAVLSPGMRAVAVPVNETSGIAGLIFPGDRVDLLLSHSVPVAGGDNGETFGATETVLQDIRVLAIDQSLDETMEGPQVGDTATLEVTPKQAEMISVMLHRRGAGGAGGCTARNRWPGRPRAGDV